MQLDHIATAARLAWAAYTARRWAVAADAAIVAVIIAAAAAVVAAL